MLHGPLHDPWSGDSPGIVSKPTHLSRITLQTDSKPQAESNTAEDGDAKTGARTKDDSEEDSEHDSEDDNPEDNQADRESNSG